MGLTALNDRLYEVACARGNAYESSRISLILRWMKEATQEIERLQGEIDSLERTLASRTEHLV